MKIEMRPIDSIKPCATNPRWHDEGIDAIAASIREFGFRQPIVVSEDDEILAGHGRYWAARQLGMLSVPVHVAVGLTPAQARAYRLADNKVAEYSRWNDDLLAQELAKLQEENFDLNLTGFSAEELAWLLEQGPRTTPSDPDDIPESPEAAITQAGDLWLLGNHRLRCGDSSKPEDVDRLLAGATVHLVVTDPPYGVNVEPRSKNAIAFGLSSFTPLSHHQKLDVSRQPAKARPTDKKLRARDRQLANDFLPAADFERLLEAWFSNIARVLQPGRSFYLFGGYSNCGTFPPLLQKMGLHFSQALIWAKEHAVLTRKDYMGDHEWCFYGWREGAAHAFFGPNNATDVWAIKKVAPRHMVHLTEKPVELLARAIQYSSRPRENVLDLFTGSGTTLIAAEQNQRRALLMELDPLYCDVIVTRWQKFTGRQAQRESVAAMPTTLAGPSPHQEVKPVL